MSNRDIERQISDKVGKIVDNIDNGFTTKAGLECEDLADLFVKLGQRAKEKEALESAAEHYRKVIEANKDDEAPFAQKRLKRVKERIAALK
jgi:hypothetical protein